MEFHEKLQSLRKQKGLTQEELAAFLFVSRAAVSKWESARGYPGIDSLKALAKFFGITIDQLLSGDELLTIAEEDKRQQERRLCSLVFGLLDCSTILLFFLPFFGQKEADYVRSVPLISLSRVSLYLLIAYYLIVVGIVILGICQLAFRDSHRSFPVHSQSKLSLALTLGGTLLFIISQQPYAATFLFIFLAVKAVMLIKWR